jgi:hypothetical protein
MLDEICQTVDRKIRLCTMQDLRLILEWTDDDCMMSGASYPISDRSDRKGGKEPENCLISGKKKTSVPRN